MTKIKLSLLTVSVVTLATFQGCTPKTAGADSAYLNKNRGASGAQISAAEAEQYNRQQGLAADEIRLENMKRHQTTDAIQEGAGAASSVSNAASGAVDAINSFKGLFGR
jgi:hypothetical protein